ncbi:MAG: DUF3307 domain-containing protein [Alphaproteobacteria bacterium]|nr:DUF3307 domain-containing protein [Alphaproteobacteria bacterium]MBV9372809.1 DUF3307 domain-containing protein [Alphaproteobacteria bacterium]MBV9900496.1 DUF3307 domain-containing protein [Alphaproteobacteria bacterium]
MLETATSLITAHLVADFILQGEWLIQRKARFPYLLLHGGVVAGTAAVTLGLWSWAAAAALAVIAGTHLLIDCLKIRYGSDSLSAFLVDQLAHFLVIAAVVATEPRLSALGVWSALPGDKQAMLYAAMTFVGGAIVAVPLGGILIKKALVDLAPSTPSSSGTATTPIAGMMKGGKYIGWLERGLTLLLTLTGRVEGVGFLLAAKSILRLGDIKTETERHQAEYIIIGTFSSFGWGLAVALLTAKLIASWHAF